MQLLVCRLAPTEDSITDYDRMHFLTYARLLDADRACVGWRAMACSILYLDVDSDPEGAKACVDSHLARARWVVGPGCRTLILPLGADAASEDARS